MVVISNYVWHIVHTLNYLKTNEKPNGVVVRLWTYYCFIVFLVLLNMCFLF